MLLKNVLKIFKFSIVGNFIKSNLRWKCQPNLLKGGEGYPFTENYACLQSGQCQHEYFP